VEVLIKRLEFEQSLPKPQEKIIVTLLNVLNAFESLPPSAKASLRRVLDSKEKIS
jgi:hypothetical protein